MTKAEKKFRNDFRKLLRAKDRFEKAKEALDAAKEPVLVYVLKHGEENRPGTAQRCVELAGWKIQNTLRDTKPKIDEAKRLAWCEANAPHVIIQRPIVEEDTWTALKAAGKVHSNSLRVIEVKTASYYLRWWVSGKAECPECGKAVHPNDPFCRHCGFQLASDKKRKPKKSTKKKSKPRSRKKAA